MNTPTHSSPRPPFTALVEDKILDWAGINKKIYLWRFKSEKIVFTNGCFDLLHRGHIQTLAEAAMFGTKLIVGLNADASVQRLKGNSRPVQDQNSRAILLASLFFVDAVVIFEQDTPLELIKHIQPDVLVKGGDYTPENIIGADIVTQKGGTVQVIPYLDGFSTSRLLFSQKT